MEYFIIFCVCTISGILTGLLGFGGGLVIIPVFIAVLPFFGLHFSVHQIIAISTTCVFTNSAISIFYRRKEKFLSHKILLPIAVSVIVGSLFSTYLTNYFPEKLLLSLYLLISIISLYFIHKDVNIDLSENKILNSLLYPIFVFIGALSAAVGIGGAVFFATMMKCFYHKNMKELLPSITFLVLCNAFVAFTGRFAFGQVTLDIIPIAILSSIIGAKIGVKISQKLSANTLNKLMTIFLILAILRVAFELF